MTLCPLLNDLRIWSNYLVERKRWLLWHYFSLSTVSILLHSLSSMRLVTLFFVSEYELMVG
jgi:hypothetical protein